MAAGFRTRKVHVEQSLGDKLKRARVRRKLSIAQVEEATCIRSKFILALESDSWDQIPSEVYGRGYLETYCEYLHLPTEQMLKQYDKSRAAYNRHTAALPVELAPASRVSFSKFLLTPKLLIMVSAAVVGLGFAAMVGYQINAFASAPVLELAAPASAQETGIAQLEVGATSFTLNGRTSQGATVQVNGQPVAVLQDGTFSSTVQVQRGVNAVVVEALSTNGKKSSETLAVTVK